MPRGTTETDFCRGSTKGVEENTPLWTRVTSSRLVRRVFRMGSLVAAFPPPSPPCWYWSRDNITWVEREKAAAV